MTSFLEYTFVQNAIIGSFFTAIICAIYGTLTVVNRNVFITGGVAHATYGGIGLALFIGFSPLLGALAFALIIGVIIAVLYRNSYSRTDAVISALWAFGMAFGTLLIDLTPGYNTDLLSYLFGNILLVSKLDLILMGIFTAVSVLLIIIYYRTVLAVSADPEYASTLGLPVKRTSLIMMVLLCISVVMLIRVSGLILVMALLAIPASIAENHTRTLAGMMVFSGVLAAIIIAVGMTVSYRLNLTPSAVVVSILSIIYLIDTIVRKHGPA